MPKSRTGSRSIQQRRASLGASALRAFESIVLSCVALGTPQALRAESDVDRWIEVDSALFAERSSAATGWVEIRARARQRPPRPPYHVVLGLDLSESAFGASGFDVDGDGTTASSDPARGGRGRPRGRALPVGDSIAAAGREALQAFVRGLDGRDVRAALMTFAGSARIEHALDDPHVIEAELGKLRLWPRASGTDIAEATRTALRLLETCEGCADPEGLPPERIVLLVTDGVPTAPLSPRVARRAARRSVRAVSASGARVFALSPRRSQVYGVLRELTRLGGGTTFRARISDAWRTQFELARGAAVRGVRLSNRTTGDPGRAVRWFADGSIDGVVRLAQGSNDIRLEVELEDGSRLEQTIPVRLSLTEDLDSLGELVSRLRLRGLETELGLRAVAGRSRRERALAVEVHAPTPHTESPEPTSRPLPCRRVAPWTWPHSLRPCAVERGRVSAEALDRAGTQPRSPIAPEPACGTLEHETGLEPATTTLARPHDDVEEP